MGLILFFVVCALVFLFYKVDKLSREIYSLELDIARLLRERTLDETFRESEGSEGSLKTGNVASANPAGSKSETLRPTNGGADGFADAKRQDASFGEPETSHGAAPGYSPQQPEHLPCGHGMPPSAGAGYDERTALGHPDVAFGNDAGRCKSDSPAAFPGEILSRPRVKPSAVPQYKSSADVVSKPSKSFEPAQWDIGAGKREPFNFAEFLRRYVAANALLWIGALALALSGIFLAKYSIERGLLTPTMRVLGAAFMAAVLFAAGEFVLRKFSNKMMAGLLVGAGITVAYGDLCAAAQLYSMMPLWVALFGMVVLSVLAYGFAERYGIGMFYLAIMGLFIAPALTAGDNPSTLLLVCYLSIATVACAYAAVRQNCVPALLFIIVDNICWILFWHLCALINISHGFDINNYLYIFAYMLFYSWVAILARARIKFSNFYAKASEFFDKTFFDGSICAVLLKTFIRDVALIFSAFVFLFDFLTFSVIPDESIIFFIIFAYCLLWRMRGKYSAVFTGIFCAAGMPSCLEKFDYTAVCLVCAILIPIAIGIFFSQRDKAVKLGLILMVLLWVCAINKIFIFSGAEFAYKFSLAAVIVASVFAGYVGLFKKAFQYAYLRAAYIFAGVLLVIVISCFFEFKAHYNFQFFVFACAAVAAAAIASFRKTKDWALRFAAVSMQTFVFFLLLVLFFEKKYLDSFYIGDVAIISEFIVAAAISMGLLAYFAINSKGYSNVFGFFGMISSICLVFGFAFCLSRLMHSGQEGPLTMEVEMSALSLSSLISIPIFILSKRISFTGMGIGAHMAAFLVGLIAFYCTADIFSARISGWIIANTLTVSMIALAAAYFILARLEVNGNLKMFFNAVALLIVFLWANLQVRFYFHPNVLGGAMGEVEFYSYSVLWMFIGLASLVCGRLRKSACLEYASLAFVLAAVFKVFFFDAAELGGLLRVASFGLLGVILFGIGSFYARFVFRRN